MLYSQKDDFHVLIVDDHSPDGTALVVKDLMKKHQTIFLEERKRKSGLGTAYIHGFKWALKNNYDYIFEMDADFSHSPDDLPRLLYTCHKNGADVCVGSRYVTEVNNKLAKVKILAFVLCIIICEDSF